jgi:hypothetical protein
MSTQNDQDLVPYFGRRGMLTDLQKRFAKMRTSDSKMGDANRNNSFFAPFAATNMHKKRGMRDSK